MNEINDTIEGLAKIISQKQKELDGKIRTYNAKIAELEGYLAEVSTRLDVASDMDLQQGLELAKQLKCSHCQNDVFGEDQKFVILPIVAKNTDLTLAGLPGSTVSHEASAQPQILPGQHKRVKKKKFTCSYCNSHDHKRAECPKKLGIQ
ncbi:unnamed protein product [Kuraishia capsulata CBS 1993]|uniref:CCHC-type domain-containing protein n=1 Tax=Kuraishia capsulata CBS 1993 TaxID=1382522 RepID=W6MXV4_9ASCO|nr:uncharacterized protein KUCA_T00005532001 [Kuraishia capsulata CBS 1993]CDK29540.1 unnamed protein product [Kuraishia capsulata CBS 1993]